MLYYTYILRCFDGSLYSGITTDLDRRFREHASGGGRGAKYTRRHPPVKFEAAWVSENRSAASKLECRLKKLTHAEKEELISGGDIEGYCRVTDLPCAKKDASIKEAKA